MSVMPRFSRESMVTSLTKLARLLPLQGTTIDLAVYGSACLMLATTLRDSVSTIDAVAVEGQLLIDEAAGELARKHGWPSDWLNDNMRIHLNRKVEAPSHHMLLLQLPPSLEHRLRVFVPDWDYLLSLEVSSLALDQPINSERRTELKHLMRVVGIGTPTDLDDLLSRYNSEQCQKRRMAALAHSVWWQCATTTSEHRAHRVS